MSKLPAPIHSSINAAIEAAIEKRNSEIEMLRNISLEEYANKHEQVVISKDSPEFNDILELANWQDQKDLLDHILILGISKKNDKETVIKLTSVDFYGRGWDYKSVIINNE